MGFLAIFQVLFLHHPSCFAPSWGVQFGGVTFIFLLRWPRGGDLILGVTQGPSQTLPGQEELRTSPHLNKERRMDFQFFFQITHYYVVITRKLQFWPQASIFGLKCYAKICPICQNVPKPNWPTMTQYTDRYKSNEIHRMTENDPQNTVHFFFNKLATR